MAREYTDVFIEGPSQEPSGAQPAPQPSGPSSSFGKAASLIARAIAGVKQRQQKAMPTEEAPSQGLTQPAQQKFAPIPETQNTGYDPMEGVGGLNESANRSFKTLGMAQNILERFVAGATTGTLGTAEGIFRTPEAISRVTKAGMEGLGVKPETTSKMSPLDTAAKGVDVGGFHIAGFSDVADQIRVAQKLLPTLHKAFRQNQESNKQLDLGTKEIVDYIRTKGKSPKPKTLQNALFNPSVWLQSSGVDIGNAVAEAVFKGKADKLTDVIKDPAAWAGNIGNAVPSLLMAHASAGSIGFMGWMEGMEFANSTAEFEDITGIKIDDKQYTLGILQQSVINSMLEKMGYDQVFKQHQAGTSKLLKSLMETGFKTSKSAATEGFTEALQQFNGNLSTKLFVDTKQELLEGLVSSFMGGFGSGGMVTAMSDATKYMEDVTNTLSDFNDRLGQAGNIRVPGPSKKDIADKVNERVNDQTQTPEFKKWFGESKVVDESGKPLRVYHGTVKKFNTFRTDPDELDRMYLGDVGANMMGAFFSEKEEIAATYPPGTEGNERRRTIPVYLSIKNPIFFKGVPELREAMSKFIGVSYAADAIKGREYAKKFKQHLINSGYDGIIFKEGPSHDPSRKKTQAKTFLVFNPTQIKSATGNRGTFDPENPDIRYRRPTQEEAFLGKSEEELDAMDDIGKAFIAKYLPELVDHVKTPLLLFGKGNHKILGDYLDGTIRVQRGEVLPIWQHEAGHAFFDLFLSEDERVMYREAAKKAFPEQVADYMKTFKVDEAYASEEALMELAERVDAGQYDYRGKAIPAKIVMFLKEVISRIRAFFGSDRAKLDGFFRAFYSNRRTVVKQPGFRPSLRPNAAMRKSVKQNIHETTGIKDTSDKVELSEAKLLKQSILDKARGARWGYREGRAEGKRRLIEKYTQNEASVESRKKSVQEYINENAPSAVKRGLLAIINAVKTETDMLKAFLRVDNAIYEHDRKEAISEIKKLFGKADSIRRIAVEYRDLIQAIEDEINFKNRRINTINRLKKTKAWIDKKIASGEDVYIPKRVYEAVQSLEKTNINDLELNDLYILYDTLYTLLNLGEVKQENRQSAIVAERASIKAELLTAKTHAIESAKMIRAKIGERLGMKDTARNLFKTAHNKLQAIDLNLTGMDTFFDILDGGVGYSGTWYRNFKRRIDTHFSKYLTDKWAIQDRAYEMVKRLKLDDRNFERIGVFAANAQEGGREKLLNNGITEKEIDSIKLTDKEMEYYAFMRSEMDALFPHIKNMMAEVYNEDVGQVKNYFSFMTDFDLVDELEIAQRAFDSEDRKRLQTKPNLGFTEERKGAGNQKIKINAHDIFTKHIDNAIYAINLTASTRMLNQILMDEDIQKALGLRGTTIIKQWLDLVNRKGGVAGQQQMKELDFLRRNLGIATLGFKLSSAMKQPLAVLNGAELIGRYAFMGQAVVAADPRWRKLVYGMPEIRERVGDDPAFTEASGFKPVRAVQMAGMAPLKALDSMTAAGIAAGAYMAFMDRMNAPVDFNNVNPDGVDYAQQIVRRSQSTSLFKDVPLVVSRGKYGETRENRSIAKTILQFQTFMLSQWNIIRHDLPSDIRRGRNMDAARKAFFFASAIAGEVFVSNLSKDIISAMFGGGDDKEDKEFLKQYMMSALQSVPFVSQGVSAANYGSIPVPLISNLTKQSQNFKYMFQAKNPETRAKWARIAAVEAIGGFAGVPGTAQLSQVLRKQQVRGKKSRGKFRD